MSPLESENDDALKVPDALAARLRKLGGPDVLVPPAVDEAILEAARQHLAGAARRQPRQPLRWLAAAAVLALCAWLAHSWFFAGPMLAREDVNQDGRVDILDAFAVARRLQQGPVTTPEWDINHDGVVDQRDIDAIAAEAVRLAKGNG